MKTLVLVDGSSYLYRAFFALPPLTNPQGEPTGAMYGVLNMLKKLIQDYQPDYIGVVFDPKGPTTRHTLSPAYKAHRPAMPDDLSAQVTPLFQMIQAMGLPLIQVDGVEADDVIGTLAKQGEKHGLKVVISTGDKDLAQLVNEHITLINTMNNVVLDREGVIQKFGVPPERIVDYLALVGDTSDNIAGVPGCGPKTAVKWLNQYGSLAEIIAKADTVTGKVGENLRAAIPQLPLTEQLVTIDCEIPLSISAETLIAAQPNVSALSELYQHYAFKTWLHELTKAASTAHTPAQTFSFTHQTIIELDAWQTLIAQLEKLDYLVLDTETTGLDHSMAQLVGISLAYADKDKAIHSFYIPLRHNYLGAPEQLPVSTVLSALQPLLADPKRLLIGHNLKYDIAILANENVDVHNQLMDTMLMAFVLASHQRLDMDSLAATYLHYRTQTFAEVAGKGKKQLTFNEVDVTSASFYAAEDTAVTLGLYHVFKEKLEDIPSLQPVLNDIELPLIPILVGMERHGVLIDAKLLHEQSKTLEAMLFDIDKNIAALAGESVNINSPKQLQVLLYDKLQLPVLQKTPTGQPSTAEDVLQELAHTYELPKLILDYRSASKLKSTYTDKLPLQINPRTGRVHTSYHQAGAATGRFSSSDPNLQNIPARTELGRQIRQAFIAPPNCLILAADYSQIELRIMAHLANDPGLLNAFHQGLDIHKATASEVLDIPLDEVTPEQRRSAKAINFGLIYGMSAFGLAKQLDVERGVAKHYMDSYFHKYPNVHHYMETTRELAHKQGYVETLFGRRLYLPDINAKNPMLRNSSERAAINAPMQGTAADIIKRAMIAMAKRIASQQLPLRLIMQVHDELVFEVQASALAECRAIVKEVMEQTTMLAVPLLVSLGSAPNWEAAH